MAVAAVDGAEDGSSAAAAERSGTAVVGHPLNSDAAESLSPNAAAREPVAASGDGRKEKRDLILMEFASSIDVVPSGFASKLAARFETTPLAAGS